VTVTRRLAAILAADVAGYSRLMGADEEGTHERLKAHLGDLVNPKIAEYRGRIVKNTGDGMLAEFPSVVDAVRCAAELQRAMIDREVSIPEDRRIRFRAGINLGDVIVDGDDIFGDGVNVAARLESLSDPGGMCISRMVRDQIRDKLAYAFKDLGEQSVKNIARPVRVYALRPEAIADLPAPGVLSSPPISQSTAAPRLSIVVLPFANLSNDPDQQYFADGITEDLTADLSRIADMFVISRNTAFTYQGKRVDTKQVGRELCVRYVLEGSVRRSGHQVRVTAQLIDAERDAHLWAERFDGDTGDLFGLQNEITGQIARALQFELVIADAGRLTEHRDVVDYILQGRAAWWKSTYGTNYAEALELFERALALDPRAVEAQIWSALMLVNRVLDFASGFFHYDAPDVELQRADELIAQALAVSPNSPWAHYVKGQVLRAQLRYEDAAIEFETAIAFDRNLANAYAWLGRCKLLIGSVDEVIPPTEYAIRLSPRDRNVAPWYGQIGAVHLLKARTDEAVRWLEKARSAHAGLHFIHAYLAAGYALKGETGRASVALDEAHKLSDRYSSIARLKTASGTPWFEPPKLRALAEATFFAGLRLAGVPEE
jgi:TolB-like protein/class 3 adenylate cyclase